MDSLETQSNASISTTVTEQGHQEQAEKPIVQ